LVEQEGLPMAPHRRPARRRVTHPFFSTSAATPLLRWAKSAGDAAPMVAGLLGRYD
jgi:hypothetical protein